MKYFPRSETLLMTLPCLNQGQWGDRSGAYEGELRERRADRRPEDGADEEWVSGTSAAAEGPRRPDFSMTLCKTHKVLCCSIYGNRDAWHVLIHPLLYFHRIKRSRNWQRSAMSWSPKWEESTDSPSLWVSFHRPSGPAPCMRPARKRLFSPVPALPLRDCSCTHV